MNTTFQVPEEFQNALKDSMRGENGVKLPFSAPTMWWFNGKPALKNVKEIATAQRFGGWGISKEEIDGFSDLPELPSNWQLRDDLTNGKGETYSAFLCRTAFVAPIARRWGWFDFDGKSRSAVNILCYLAVMQQDKSLLPWGPVVLSAKSYTGNDLDACFKNFASKTTSLRGTALPNFFYHPIGTWGAEPKFIERKGKNASSSVTPPQLYEPTNGYNVEALTKWFVSTDVMSGMNDYLASAKEWLADWKNKNAKQAAPIIADANEPPMPEEDGLPY